MTLKLACSERTWIGLGEESRWIGARASAAASFAGALQQCDRIVETSTKEVCKTNVLALQSASPPGLSAQARQFQAMQMRSVGDNALPTVSFERAKSAFDKVVGLNEQLKALAINATKATPPATKEARDAQRKRLDERKSTLAAEITNYIADRAKDDTMKPDATWRTTMREALAKSERTQTDLTSQAQLEADPAQREIILSKLNTERLAAIQKVQTYDTLAQHLAGVLAELDELLAAIRQFNEANN